MNSRTSSAGHRHIALLLGAMLFLGSAYFYQDPEWNGNSRLDLTRAIVESGSLNIDEFHDAPGWYTGDKAFFQGHFYSDKAIGSSVLAVPIYFLLFRLAAIFAMPLEASLIKHVLTTSVMGTMFMLTGVSMYSIAIRLAQSGWVAVLATVCVSFGTMLLPYSAVFYGHVPAAGFLILTFALLVAARDISTAEATWQWFWIGLAVAMAFICDFTSAVVVPGLAAYGIYVLRGRSIRQMIQTAWPALPGVVIPWMILVAYNLAIYGRPLEFGYSYEVEERFQEIMGLGLMGMRLPSLSASYHITLDPKFGLLWQSPVVLLAPLGYALALRHRKNIAIAAVSLFAITAIFLMNAASYLWYGGSAFGPRLLISALPFFVVPLAMLPPGTAWALAGLGAVSVANMLIPLMGKIQITRLEFEPGRGGFRLDGSVFQGFSLLYDYGLREVVRLQGLGQSPWTLGTAVGMPMWSSIVVWLLAQFAALLHMRRKIVTIEG